MITIEDRRAESNSLLVISEKSKTSKSSGGAAQCSYVYSCSCISSGIGSAIYSYLAPTHVALGRIVVVTDT